MTQTLASRWIALALATATLAIGFPESVDADGRVPQGFDGYFVYVADGEWAAGTPHSVVPGCDIVPLTCDGEYFWYEILGATPDEMLAAEQAAKDFMLVRFGLEVDALVAAGDVTFRNVYADPRNNYRVRTLPGENIHQYGWTVHDQAFFLTTNVEITLGGEYEGVVLPAGSSIADGLYVIQRSRLDWVDGEPVLTEGGGQILVDFQSSGAIPPPIDPRMPITGACEITDSPWGTGIAMFSALWTSLDGVLTKAATRNVITLDSAAGYGAYPGVESDPEMTVLD